MRYEVKKKMKIYTGKTISIEKRVVRFPTGIIRKRVVVHPRPAVAILPREGERCILIKQYRYALGKRIYEAPAGTMEPGESPSEAAQRELIEETGYEAGELVPVGYIYTSPGFTDEVIHLFLGYNLSPSSKYEKDEDEVIDVVEFPFSEVRAMIARGEIVDSKTICLVQRACEQLSGEYPPAPESLKWDNLPL